MVYRFTMLVLDLVCGAVADKDEGFDHGEPMGLIVYRAFIRSSGDSVGCQLSERADLLTLKINQLVKTHPGSRNYC
jgi:hypothetical protein